MLLALILAIAAAFLGLRWLSRRAPGEADSAAPGDAGADEPSLEYRLGSAIAAGILIVGSIAALAVPHERHVSVCTPSWCFEQQTSQSTTRLAVFSGSVLLCLLWLYLASRLWPARRRRSGREHVAARTTGSRSAHTSRHGAI